jgi:hypothetical protein
MIPRFLPNLDVEAIDTVLSLLQSRRVRVGVRHDGRACDTPLMTDPIKLIDRHDAPGSRDGSGYWRFVPVKSARSRTQRFQTRPLRVSSSAPRGGTDQYPRWGVLAPLAPKGTGRDLNGPGQRERKAAPTVNPTLESPVLGPSKRFTRLGGLRRSADCPAFEKEATQSRAYREGSNEEAAN